MFSCLDLARRSLAIGLLGLFSALSLVPLVSSDPQSNLPACCRRDGKHHCSMMQVDEPSAQSSGLSAVAPRCPLFPKLTAGAGSIQLYPLVTRASSVSIVNQSSAHMQAEVEHRVSPARAHQKRGPPSLISRG